MSAALDALMERAINDPRNEPAFLAALLDAELFIHRPRNGPKDRLRIVQFNRPDGLQVIPVFTDVTKARAASSSTVEIVGMPGRVLFEATRGATLMLNPNDATCTLYPEEIADLLRGRSASPAPVTFNADGVLVHAAPRRDHWIGHFAVDAVRPIEPVTALYQLSAKPGNQMGMTTLLVIAVPERHAERAARAISAHLQARAVDLPPGIDLTSIDPVATLPDWLSPFGESLVWRRNSFH